MVRWFVFADVMMCSLVLLTLLSRTPCFVVPGPLPTRAVLFSPLRMWGAPTICRRDTALSAAASSSPPGLPALSSTALQFLKTIEDYGRSRMARKAVGVLSKMEAYGEAPSQEHYTAVIAACEQSEQFETAIGVFREMKSVGLVPVVRTYEHLVGCAEKTGHWQAALALFEEMTHDAGLRGTTTVYNSCMWAAEQGGRPDISLDLLADMESQEVPRDAATYAACAYACERAGDGNVALHVMEMMRAEGHPVGAPVYKAAIWACVKSGQWERGLALFDELEPAGTTKDESCYEGAIWACAEGGRWERAVELLRLMKVDSGLPRKALAYDGALTALQRAGRWEACLDMLTWMDREQPPTAPTATTYATVLKVLDDAGRVAEADELYQKALRDECFVPWVGTTRLCDFRAFPNLAVAKAAARNVLGLMRTGKLGVFNLHMAVADAPSDEWTHDHQVAKDNEAGGEEDGGESEAAPAFDADGLEAYLQSLAPQGHLQVSRVAAEGTQRLVLSRDGIEAWVAAATAGASV